MCFTFGDNGNVNTPYDITTSEIMVNIIKAVIADQVTIDDNVMIIGNTTMRGNTTMEGNTTIVRTCNMSNDLTVLGGSLFSNTMRIKTPSQGGGNLRIEPAVNGNESSVGYYSRSDLRATSAGDMCASGVNAFARVGFPIGTPI